MCPSLPPPEKKGGGEGAPTDVGCCKPHVDYLEREVHFHSEKSSSRGLKPAGPLSKIHFFMSSRREAQWGEISTVSVFNRKGKWVWGTIVLPPLGHLPAGAGAVSMASL